MMEQLTIGSFGRARVWCNEVAGAVYRGSGVKTAVVPARENCLGSRSVVVEVLIPRGPRAEYGLLGLGYVPRATGRLEVKIDFTDLPADLFSGSLAGALDEVRAGLPGEYAESVAAGVMSSVDLLGSGCVRVEEAARGIVGSSPKMFERLSRVVMEILGGREASAAISAEAFQAPAVAR